ncbi:MAG: TIGR03619 family F420-dependent LLM class oxidoreductase [Thaumarchaeota archaeon]|nr:TIGR03619 family F420-dependent LLM class oxidoreductase [Nitrososphaerota archaeon]
MTAPRFGIRILNYGRDANRKGLIEQARATDEEGYYSLWVAERLVVPFNANQGWSKLSPACYEVLTLLSYVAGITDKVKLGTFVLLAPLRNPIVLAKQVATMDELSKGRMILGLGLGWMREEFEVSNVPLKERAPRTDETIAFLREVWRKDRKKVQFSGRFFKLRPMVFDPKPRQEHVPIWIGGESIPALRRTGRLGDGWLSNTWRQPARIKAGAEVIRKEAEAKGRSFEDITISCKLFLKGDKSERSSAVRRVEKLQEVGVSHVMVDFEHDSASDYTRKLRSFARDVMRSF